MCENLEIMHKTQREQVLMQDRSIRYDHLLRLRNTEPAFGTCMVKLIANFESDGVAHLRAHMLQVQGWEATEVGRLDDRDVRNYFFEARRRRLAPQARFLKIADDFQCPPSEEAGWKALQDKVRKGEDLNPHLSKGHASLFNNDGLLAEWGVHHFHLGTKPDCRNRIFVERTRCQVFALVADTAFCAINVYPHGPNERHYEEVGIIESIHRNWPDIISAYRVNATAETWNEAQRQAFRKKNANVFVSTADGTVYMPIGGGVMASGVKFESVWCADKWHDKIQSLQARFERQLGELMPTFEQRGYAGENEIEGQLKIAEAGYQVFFPKYGVLANLLIEPARTCP